MTSPTASPFRAGFLVAAAILLLRVGVELSFAGELGVRNGQGEPVQRLLTMKARQLDGAFLDGITNRSQWEAQRPRLHRQYLEMLGLWPLPDRTPLNAQVTGVLERNEGFRVEKLHFQSRPHLYVTGNLYLPRDATAGAKLPAVLYVCGHAGRGRDGGKTAFQQHGMWFATHGYVCLIIDTLQLGEIPAIHHGTYRENRWWWQARGYTPAGVECWNGIRALDYLQTRPEVDGSRLAVTGISGGGAASFWIAAADDRVKVAVPVSGMSDLEDYVGDHVVNGHCDCMFLINTFQWPWTQIAALVAPRPLLFGNSGHDNIFPMTGNDRIRARLETVYGFYTNRTSHLFDVAVAPGGHEDKPELRLMAYRWINSHLKGEDLPVTEPDLPKFEGAALRAFPNELPQDEINTKIDESFVPVAVAQIPESRDQFARWRGAKMAELRRIVFPALPGGKSGGGIKLTGRQPQSGIERLDSGDVLRWKFFPSERTGSRSTQWLVVLDEKELPDTKPAWLEKLSGGDSVFQIASRAGISAALQEPPPFYVHRALPLLGATIDTLRVGDVLKMADAFIARHPGGGPIKITGRGAAGVIAAYAALFEPRLSEVVVVDPPTSHRTGPIFLNVLRVVDVPQALGLLAPRPLTILTAQSEAFGDTSAIYRVAGGEIQLRPLR
ncbi:MAG: hypothetical protein QOF48_3583 [Verrucomicrobiota bacterium]|jgi:dienelactone hydrolase